MLHYFRSLIITNLRMGRAPDPRIRRLEAGLYSLTAATPTESWVIHGQGRRRMFLFFPIGLVFLSLVVAVALASPREGGNRAQALVVPDSPSEYSQGLLEYMAPLPGAQLVSPSTTIAFRSGIRAWPPEDVSILVEGSASGPHAGQTILADDHATTIFLPDEPFTAGEIVSVVFELATPGNRNPLSYTFQVAHQTPAETSYNWLFSSISGGLAPDRIELLPSTVLTTTGRYFTAPADFPLFNVYRAPGTSDGFVFLGYLSFSNNPTASQYLLILDNDGQPIFFDAGPLRLDFKKQPNGLLTYFDQDVGHFLALDQSYNIVDEFAAGNGYTTDLHDLQLLDNGHFLLLIYDIHQVDMSLIVPGGDPNATVVGCVVQELDTARNVVFEWRSWDHISVLDSNQNLTAPVIDYVHCNSIGEDLDGHLLMSSRHLDEVTKINRQTGQIMWRLGGVGNQFTFTNDDGFFLQHDARRLPNGNLTIFDNSSSPHPQSRAIEYSLDEINMTATRVWQYRNNPDVIAWAMGNHQRLPNGNSMIGWGTSNVPMLTEVMADGTEVFEISVVDTSFTTYRAFRFPWHGYPSWPPLLRARQVSSNIELYFSWNGATDVASYDIYASPGLTPDQYIGNVARTGFETRFDYVPDSSGLYSFKIIPRDISGQPGLPSSVYWLIVDGVQTFFPVSFWTAP